MKYQFVHDKFEVNVNDKEITIGDRLMQFESKSLAYYLNNCQNLIVLVATLGIEADRTISSLEVSSLSKAVEYDYKCLEFLEEELDKTCRDLQEKEQGKLKTRYSPGFGDFSLDNQSQILDLVDAKRQLGITVKNNYMIPQKTVTAVIGIEGC